MDEDGTLVREVNGGGGFLLTLQEVAQTWPNYHRRIPTTNGLWHHCLELNQPWMT